MSGVRTSRSSGARPSFRSSRGRAAIRRVVRDGGGHDDDVAVGRMSLHRGLHLASAAHRHDFDARRWSQMRRSGDQRRRAPPVAPPPPQRRIPSCRSSGCRRSARVDVLVGRPGGHEHAAAEQRARAAAAPARPPRRSLPARPAGPCRSSRTPDSPRPARRSGRRAPPACPGCAARPRARTCWCSSPAPSAPARASRDTASVRKSSAMPLANLPMMFAVAGATSSRSMSVASAMCSMSAFAPRRELIGDDRPPRDRLERDLADELASPSASSSRRRRGRASAARARPRRPCRRRCRRSRRARSDAMRGNRSIGDSPIQQLTDRFVSIFAALAMTSFCASVVFLCSPSSAACEPASSCRARAPATTTNSNVFGNLLLIDHDDQSFRCIACSMNVSTMSSAMPRIEPEPRPLGEHDGCAADRRRPRARR